MTLSDRLHRLQAMTRRLPEIESELEAIANELDSHADPIIEAVRPPAMPAHRLKDQLPVSGAEVKTSFREAKARIDKTIHALQTAYSDKLPPEDRHPSIRAVERLSSPVG